MNHNKTDITIVLDRSGSMSSVAEDTIGGFNRFLEDQKKVPGEAVVTLVQFDNEYEVVYTATPVTAVKPLSATTFLPRGYTALHDAICRTIKSTGERLEATPESERPGKVIFVILTDGHENASTKYSAKHVHDMTTHQTEKYNWQFVFLGANQDAVATANTFGISVNAAMSYAHNSAGTLAAFGAVSRNLTAMRCSVGPTKYQFMDTDRKEQEEAGLDVK